MGLTKENYFDGIKERYPDAFAHFGKWIDEYKTSVQWRILFNVWYGKDDDNIHRLHPAPKLHDLPFEMQQGIILKYMTVGISNLSVEHRLPSPRLSDGFTERLEGYIREHFELLLKKHQEKIKQ